MPRCDADNAWDLLPIVAELPEDKLRRELYLTRPTQICCGLN